MMNAIRHDELPSFYFMQYDLATWRVRNLLLVPHFAFPPSAIIKRPPLSRTARRAGWVGCNFALNRIPVEARIPVVTESRISPTAEVRAQFKRVKPLKEISITQRGWTLDVLNVVRRLVDSRRRGNESGSAAGKEASLLTSAPTGEFSTADTYAFTRELEKLHPDNRHVRDKIRQQLQVLRDTGLLLYVGRGVWRLP
jgi:type II restriction enzyme